MLKPTLTAFVDQALLSALSFLAALALIRLAPASEYGLYTQLLNLQSLFSVVHVGIFVSGFLAVHPTLPMPGQAALCARLARGEFVFGMVGLPAIALATYGGALVVAAPLAPSVAAASAAAIVGLWWREFGRARYFAAFRADRVLALDCSYAALTGLGIGVVIALGRLTAGGALFATGVAGMLVGGVGLARVSHHVADGSTSAGWRDTWLHGQWETYGSLVTWLQSQSYVFFAAAAGGLMLAGSVSASRLVGMPLALAWAGCATLLRVAIARAHAETDADRIRGLAQRALLAVAAVSTVYAVVVAVAWPAVDGLLFEHKFPGLGRHVAWWLGYFALTGVSTVGAMVLRGTLQMARLFQFYVVSCATTLVALGVTVITRLSSDLVVSLVAGELVMCALVWGAIARLLRALSDLRARTSEGPPLTRDHLHA